MIRSNPQRRLRGVLTVLVAYSCLAPGAGLAQDQTPTVVSPLVSTRPLVPVPNVGTGAPLYTAAELAAIQLQARREGVQAETQARSCNNKSNRLLKKAGDRYKLYVLYDAEWDAQNRLMNAADKAAAASEAAIAARRDAALGTVDQKTVEATELARQAAVNAFATARNNMLEARAVVADRLQTKRDRTPGDRVGVEMMRMASERAANGGPEALNISRSAADLALRDVRAVEREAGNDTILVITGRVENPRAKAAVMPPLSITAVDQNGGPLKTEVADAKGRSQIPAGGSLGFNYEIKPKPGSARTVLVTFGPDHRPTPYIPGGMFCNGGEEDPDPENPEAMLTASTGLVDDLRV